MKQCVDLPSGINSLICVTTFDCFMVIAALLPEHNPSQNLHSEQQLLTMLYVAFLYSVELYNCVCQQSNRKETSSFMSHHVQITHILKESLCKQYLCVY